MNERNRQRRHGAQISWSQPGSSKIAILIFPLWTARNSLRQYVKAAKKSQWRRIQYHTISKSVYVAYIHRQNNKKQWCIQAKVWVIRQTDLHLLSSFCIVGVPLTAYSINIGHGGKITAVGNLMDIGHHPSKQHVDFWGWYLLCKHSKLWGKGLGT